MKENHQSRHFTPPAVAAALFLLLTAFAPGCVNRPAPVAVPLANASILPHSKENAGLRVAIAPYKDPAKLKEAFGKDLLAEGLLPLLVVFENNIPDASFMIRKEGVKMGTRDGAQSGSDRRLTRNAPTGAQIGGDVVTGALLGPVGVLFFRVAAREQLSQMGQHQLAERELTTQTLSPRGRAQGFVYYNFGKGAPPPKDCVVRVEALNLRDNQPVVFEFALD